MRISSVQELLNYTMKSVQKRSNENHLNSLTSSYIYGLEEEGLPIFGDGPSTVVNTSGNAINVVGQDKTIGGTAGK